MSLENLDIVYVVKDAAFNDELRYSLRSVDKNFPHYNVFFYGGKPMYLKPDQQVVLHQVGKTKWDRVRMMLKTIALDDRITEDFVLFNDDFFVMRPVESLPAYEYGTLESLCERIESRNGGRPTPYTLKLRETIATLEKDGLTTFNFELHVPFIFNRGKLLEVIERYPTIKGTRSLYGNTYLTETEHLVDRKVFKVGDLPPEDAVFISTEDRAFNEGKVGKMIRAKFPDKSKWER